MSVTIIPLPAPAVRKVGDRVSVDDPKFPGVWTIKSIGPKNTVLTPENGGRGLRAPHYLIVDAREGDAPAAPAVPFVDYHAGEVVRVEGFGGKYANDLWVVLVDKGEKVNVAKLGGDGNRYLRVGRRSLVKVDLADILK